MRWTAGISVVVSPQSGLRRLPSQMARTSRTEFDSERAVNAREMSAEVHYEGNPASLLVGRMHHGMSSRMRDNAVWKPDAGINAQASLSA
jgi:hypothetical protein